MQESRLASRKKAMANNNEPRLNLFLMTVLTQALFQQELGNLNYMKSTYYFYAAN